MSFFNNIITIENILSVKINYFIFYFGQTAGYFKGKIIYRFPITYSKFKSFIVYSPYIFNRSTKTANLMGKIHRSEDISSPFIKQFKNQINLSG